MISDNQGIKVLLNQNWRNNSKIIKIIISPIFMIIFFITKLFRLNYLLNILKTLNNITSLLRKKTNYNQKIYYKLTM